MRILKQSLTFTLPFIIAIGCGAQAPQVIVNPTTVSLSQGTPIQVTLADGNYSNATFSFSGTDIRTLGYTCTGGNGTYMQCTRSGGYGYGYGSTGYGTPTCTAQAPCQCLISVTRDGQTASATLLVTP